MLLCIDKAMYKFSLGHLDRIAWEGSSVMSLSYTFPGKLGFGMQAPVMCIFKFKLGPIVYKKG